MSPSDLEKIKKELSRFNNILFERSSHKYFILKDPENEKINSCNPYVFECSVTEYIEKYLKDESQKFNEDYWSNVIAKRRGISKREVLKEWDKKAEEGCRIGTNFHEMVCSYYKNENKTINVPIKLVKYFQNFIRDTKDYLIPIDSEIKVGMRNDRLQLSIAGTIDQLFWSEKENGLIIFDWKTNKKFKGYDIDIEGTNIEPNYLEILYYDILSYQVQMYKTIIGTVTNLEIKECYIGWFSILNNNYKIIKCTKVPLVLKHKGEF